MAGINWPFFQKNPISLECFKYAAITKSFNHFEKFQAADMSQRTTIGLELFFKLEFVKIRLYQLFKKFQ